VFARCFLAVCLPWMAVAQIEIEEQVQTDTVDLFSQPVQTAGSSKLALAAAVALPGLGHEYLGKPRRAFKYYATEAACVFGAVFFKWYSNRVFDDAKTYAWMYAGARGGGGADDAYWKDVAEFMDSDGLGQGRSTGYNQVQENNRTPEYKYTSENLQWRWIDDSLRVNYRSMIENSVQFSIISSFCIGAMFLNRLISFIDTRAELRKRGSSSLSFSPIIDPGYSLSGLRLNTEF
jgi:hypothetical protein